MIERCRAEARDLANSLRIFVSSPGDVLPERRRAQLVIEKLAKSYGRFFSIESVLWELEPMLASGHFQDQIVPPSECDIVVMLVWSRLGTSLPPKTETREYHGIDGRVPVTGTEWEFEDALAAQRKRGAPDLLAFRKQADPTVSLKDRAAKALAEEQWDRLEAFWSHWFVNRGQFRAGFSEFIDLDSFETKLESDLKSLIERRIEASRSLDQSSTPSTWYVGSPFRGLESYRFEHALIFFGRSAMVKTAVEKVAGNAERGRAFLLILGASGAGKSSLAQAGVVPALTSRGIVPGVGLWRRAVMRPAGHPDGPFAALAEALLADTSLPELSSATQGAEALARHLAVAAADPTFSLVKVLDQIEAAARARGDLLAVETTRLAVVVDQLEELFTSAEVTVADRVAFIRCLDGLARSGPIFVLATMRSDYWHRAAETPLLVDMAAGDGRLDLLAPTQDEIMEMIRQPAEVAGLGFERDPGRDIRLDATLAADATDEPGALPLLSFLLDELYKKDVEANTGKMFTYASAKQLGGLKGAIANRAEAAFSRLPTDVRAAFPIVLRALVTVRGAEPTARPAPMERFPESSPGRRIVDALLDPQVRLLVAEGDGEGARIRLAHEALITYWERAKRQLAQDRDDLHTRAKVEEAYSEWSRSADRRNRKYLLRDPLLANAVDLAGRWGGQFDIPVLDFVRASRRRARLRQQLTAAAALVFAIVSAFAVVAARQASEQTKVALEQKQVASERERFATEQKNAAEAATREADAERDRVKVTEGKLLTSLGNEKVSASDPVTGMLLADEAYDNLSATGDDVDRAEAERVLFSAFQALREAIVLGSSSALNYAEFSPDATRVASIDRAGGHLWNGVTGEEIAALSSSPAGDDPKQSDGNSPYDPRRIRFSPDGKMLVTIGVEKKYAHVWNALTGSLISKLETEEPIEDVVFSLDSRRIVTAAGTVLQLWDPSGRAQSKVSFPDRGVNIPEPDANKQLTQPLVFSPDGKRLAIGSPQGAIIWEVDSRAKFAATDGCKNFPGAFSPDGQRVVMLEACSGSKEAIVWNAANGRKILELKGHLANVYTAAYNPDGKRIVTAAGDSTARIWDAVSGRTIVVLRHSASVNMASYDRSGRFVLTASDDGTARIWNAETGAEVARLGGHFKDVVSGRFSTDAQRVVTASEDGTARIWRIPLLNSARVFKQGVTDDSDQFKPNALNIVRATLSPNSEFIATADASGRIVIWNKATGAQIRVLSGHSEYIRALVYSHDGSQLLTGSDDNTARLWNMSGNGVMVLKGHTQSVRSARFNLEENLAVTASEDETVRVWNAHSGILLRMLVGAETPLSDAMFSPDGRWVVARSDRAIYRWHDGALIKEGFEIARAPGRDPAVNAIVVSSDNMRVTALTDLGIETWEMVSGRRISVVDLNGASTWKGKFIEDGSRVLLATDSAISIFDVRTGEALGELYKEDEESTTIDIPSRGGLAVLVNRDERGKGENTWRVVLAPFFDSTASMRASIRSMVPRCLTVEQLRRYLHSDKPPSWCSAKWPYRAQGQRP
jgi:WD40 repeat protein